MTSDASAKEQRYLRVGATLSDDRKYRYRLWRLWNDKPPCVFVLLNPSTADELKDDPTVKRCMARALREGFGGIVIVNLFALRSANPVALKSCDDPIGPENNEHIRQAVRGAGAVICGWGNDGKLLGRGEQVLKMIRDEGATPLALKVNFDGSPQHPLYIGYAVEAKPMANVAQSEQPGSTRD